MMMNKLECLFKRFKGQPVEILTSDRVRYCGIDLDSDDESVEIIDKCNRIILIPFRHIDAVVEPKMKLTRFCAKDDCDCDDHHDDEECDERHHDEFNEFGERRERRERREFDEDEEFERRRNRRD